MIGRRLSRAEFWTGWHAGSLQPGDYALGGERHNVMLDDGVRQVSLLLPTGTLAVLLVASDGRGASSDGRPVWQYVEEEDGSLTLHPSLDHRPARGAPGWHGFLDHGVWRSA